MSLSDLNGDGGGGGGSWSIVTVTSQWRQWDVLLGIVL